MSGYNKGLLVCFVQSRVTMFVDRNVFWEIKFADLISCVDFAKAKQIGHKIRKYIRTKNKPWVKAANHIISGTNGLDRYISVVIIIYLGGAHSTLAALTV